MERERICNEDFSSVVAEYKANGVVVVPSVLTPEEVQACRDGLHQNLLERGIDYYQLRNSPESLANLKQFQSHQSGGLPFYYCAWQMQYCMGNLRVFEATKSIWEATWAKGIQGFENPYAPFDSSRGYVFLDSFGVNFRLPTAWATSKLARQCSKGALTTSQGPVQKTIGLHVDVNPWDHYAGRRPSKRWRPMQGFISLTDNQGGFECVPGFHLELSDYFSRLPRPVEHTQAYFGFQDAEKFNDLHQRIRPVHYKAGDAVIWDWRTPHQIAPQHEGQDTREVVYTSFLPAIQLNAKYADEQKRNLEKGIYPPDVFEYWKLGTAPGWNAESVSTIPAHLKGLL